MSTKPKKSIPRQERLPGTEGKFDDLHEAAIKYAEIRDERMRLNGEEVELKAELLKLMKKHKKETYSYMGVVIDVVHEEEDVKVKVKKPAEEQQAA